MNAKTNKRNTASSAVFLYHVWGSESHWFLVTIAIFVR